MRYAAFAVMTLLLTRCQPEQPKPQTVNLVYDSTYQRLIPHVKRGDKISFNQLPQGASIAWNSDTSPCMMLDDHTCQIRNDASKIYTFKCAPDIMFVAIDKSQWTRIGRRISQISLYCLRPKTDLACLLTSLLKSAAKTTRLLSPKIDPGELKCTELGSCLERSTPGCKRLVGRLRATTR